MGELVPFRLLILIKDILGKDIKVIDSNPWPMLPSAACSLRVYRQKFYVDSLGSFSFKDNKKLWGKQGVNE